MKRRTFLALGAGATALTAVGVIGFQAASPYTPGRPLPGGSLIVDSPGSIAFGNYRIVLEPDSFTLTHADAVVWTASPFLIAVLGQLDWSDREGYLTVDADHQHTMSEQRVTAASASGSVAIVRGLLTGDRRQLDFTCTFRADARGLEITTQVPGADMVALRFDLASQELVHGAGSQLSPFNLQGHSYLLVPREQGVGRGLQPLTIIEQLRRGAGGSETTTNAPLPIVITSAMRSIAWDASRPAELDVRDSGRLDLSVWTPELTVRLENAGNPASLMRSHTLLSGRMVAPPAWTGTGCLLGVQGGTAAVRAQVGRLQERQAAIAAVVVHDWTGARLTERGSSSWWTWQLDTGHYPGWSELTADLSAQGIRVMGLVTPMLTPPTSAAPATPRNLYREAEQAGHLVRTRGGGTYLMQREGVPAAMIDLTSPAAVDWFAAVLTELVLPACPGGFLAGGGEGPPFNAVLAEGTPMDRHNDWPRLWAGLTARVRDQAAEEPLILHRSAWRGAPPLTQGYWAGEQLTDWGIQDGMHSALVGMLSGGVSGMTLMHAEIGGSEDVDARGYGISRSAELLLRWAEWSAWTPYMRTVPGVHPERNIQADDQSVASAFAAQSRIFAALAGYREEVIGQARSEGLPALRHCWTMFPDSPAARLDDQYFYGDRFLVGPALGPGTRSRQVSLPPGVWTHAWSGQNWSGGQQAEIACPIGQPVVLHRAGDTVARRLVEEVKRAAL